jgi:hypothetical protein
MQLMDQIDWTGQRGLKFSKAYFLFIQPPELYLKKEKKEQITVKKNFSNYMFG